MPPRQFGTLGDGHILRALYSNRVTLRLLCVVSNVARGADGSVFHGAARLHPVLLRAGFHFIGDDILRGGARDAEDFAVADAGRLRLYPWCRRVARFAGADPRRQSRVRAGAHRADDDFLYSLDGIRTAACDRPWPAHAGPLDLSAFDSTGFARLVPGRRQWRQRLCPLCFGFSRRDAGLRFARVAIARCTACGTTLAFSRRHRLRALRFRRRTCRAADAELEWRFFQQ